MTIRGGRIEPKRFGDLGLVQWTIDNSDGLAIIGDAGTIALNTAAAEVVFSNTHLQVGADSKDDRKKDPHAVDHVDLFIKLSPEADMTVVSKKAPGSVGQADTNNAFLEYMRGKAHTEGDTPGCCCTQC